MHRNARIIAIHISCLYCSPLIRVEVLQSSLKNITQYVVTTGADPRGAHPGPAYFQKGYFFVIFSRQHLHHVLKKEATLF